MNILLISNYRQSVGGISGQVEILQKKLCEEGHIADVFNTHGSFFHRLTLIGKLCKIGREYDIFHIHCCSNWGFLPAVIGIRVGRKLKKRIVLTYHGGGGELFFDKHSQLVHRYLSRTDANIVLSGFLANIFENHHLPYTVIPNIIEVDDSAFRARKPIQPRFICIRAHEELYNIPCILRAFHQVQQHFSESTLMLVGDGSLHQELIRQVKKMGVPNVTFTGRIDNSEIIQYLNQADVMLSAPKVDNMPVSLIEAMNAGLLVISSRVGGVPYMIEDKVNGLLFESDNDKQLVEKMVWVMEHQDMAQCIVMKARKSIQQYQWENIKNNLYKAYEIHP